MVMWRKHLTFVPRDWPLYSGNSCGAQLVSISQPILSHQPQLPCGHILFGKVEAPASGCLEASLRTYLTQQCRVWSLVGALSIVNIMLIIRKKGRSLIRNCSDLIWNPCSLSPSLAHSYVRSYIRSPLWLKSHISHLTFSLCSCPCMGIIIH